MIRSRTRWLLVFFPLLLVACANPLVGTWTQTDLTVLSVLKADVTVTFSASTVSAEMTLVGTSATITGMGTYTSTDDQVTIDISSLGGTNINGDPVTATESGGELCITLAGTSPTCFEKKQTVAYTIEGDTLKTTIFDFELTLTRKD